MKPDLLDKFSVPLDAKGIAYTCHHDCIHVELPNNFGTLELKVWPDGDDSIGLLEGDFHTHSEIIAAENGTSQYEAFAELCASIFESKLLLIEEQHPNGVTRRTIEQSLNKYLKYLPKGTAYQIKNET